MQIHSVSLEQEVMPVNFLMKVGIFLINRSSYSVQYTFTNKIQKKKECTETGHSK
jgi:hypothetical protein